MTEFVYNNAKNANSGHILFNFNCNYHLQKLYKKDVTFYSKFKLADELPIKLKKLIAISKKTFTMLKNFKKKPIIKASSSKVIPLVIKSG